ncbi:MAG: hypothetical protein DSM106950_00400 [Stigonema ocellatum SAG 48.90 = DSM 106950]|nr:hypothetical protein [Stigonema ocellatum SAG 48.90 = DSM 106950]
MNQIANRYKIKGDNMTQDQPNRLDNLEAALARFAEITMQNVVRHDEALSRLEANAASHDEALSRLEANVASHDENF